MSFQHNVTKSVGAPGMNVSQIQPLSAGGASDFDESFPSPTTNGLMNIAFAVAQLQSIFILSDQNLTLKTNSSGAPDNTINLVANVPLEWQTGGYYTNKFTVDVTKIYVTNASGQTARLQIAVLVDPTP